jgi:GNAT superfamily N-acetyltransferase
LAALQFENRMNVVLAEGPLLERILDHTFGVWHEGLTRAAYSRWNSAQMLTPWGRERLQRFALIADDGALLATAKRYRFDARLNGRDGWMSGIGAVFTPPSQRRRGYASELIARLLDQERRAGALLASLFSEIGAPFYQRLGFQPVPFNEVTVAVKRKGGAPAMLVRAGDERDFAALAAMHETRSAGARFALRRDPPMMHYALAKKRLLAGLGPPGLRQVEFFVAEEGTMAVAYVVLLVNAHGWTLEEAGDRDPAGARLGALLQVLVAREPVSGTPLIRAWWPPAFPVPPQLELTNRTDARDLFMVRPLAEIEMPARAEDVFYWRGDYF